MRCTATVDMFVSSPAGVVPPTQPTRHQRAKDEGERGMSRAEDRAVSADEAFREKARAFVLDYLERYGETSGELITDAMEDSGINPPDSRAFGSIYSGLSKQKLIVTVRFVPRLKGHGVLGARVWRLA